MRILTVGVIACATLAVAHAQEPTPPRTVLLFVDTLHIQFRDTPQLRLGLHEGIGRLIEAGCAVALVTDADAAIRVPSTSDVHTLSAAVNRITGAAARPDATMAASDVARDAARRQREVRTALDRAIITKPSAVVIVTDATSAIGGTDAVRVAPSRIRDGVARVLDQP